jgi:hypothetical protein
MLMISHGMEKWRNRAGARILGQLVKLSVSTIFNPFAFGRARHTKKRNQKSRGPLLTLTWVLLARRGRRSSHVHQVHLQHCNLHKQGTGKPGENGWPQTSPYSRRPLSG